MSDKKERCGMASLVLEFGNKIIDELNKSMPTRKNKLIKGKTKRIMNGIPPKRR